MEQHTDRVRCLAILPSIGALPNRIISAGDDRTVRLWNPESQTIHIVRYFQHSVTALAVVPDTLDIVVGTDGGQVFLVQLVDTSAKNNERF